MRLEILIDFDGFKWKRDIGAEETASNLFAIS